MNTVTDERYMRLALSLGRRGMGRVWPNPAVGCVIVNNGRIVGRGWTQDGGRPHAEPMALAQAGDAARGATAYVTLEPCAHTGKTGPCAVALVKSGIMRCVVATSDPDPRVSGRGIKILEDAGIVVVQGTLEHQANQDHTGFFSRIVNNRPRVTLKLASSLDGKIATVTGDSKWITGPAARHKVHADRALHDAVMVGGGTVRADDPTLTVRGQGAAHQLVRIVVSNKAEFAATKLKQTLDIAPLWIMHGPEFECSDWVQDNITCIETRLNNGAVDLISALAHCAERGLTSIYCEGGATLAASLLKAGLVDDLHVYAAGKLIGGDGVSAVADLSLRSLSQAAEWSLVSVDQIGGDIRSHWRKQASSAP